MCPSHHSPLVCLSVRVCVCVCVCVWPLCLCVCVCVCVCVCGEEAQTDAPGCLGAAGSMMPCNINGDKRLEKQSQNGLRNQFVPPDLN